MTMRLSTGARNFFAKYGSIDRMLAGGRIEIYSGTQPTSADAAVAGTLLATITANGGAWSGEARAVGTVTLAGSAGSVNTLTANGVEILGVAVPFNGTLAQTALDVAAQINTFDGAVDYQASASGAVVTITAGAGTGTTPNGFVLAGTLTTLTATYAALAGGAVGANGLSFSAVLAGVLSKLASQTWSGVNAAAGTAGWFRQYSGQAGDAGALDSAGAYSRIDGAIATSGAELNLTSTAFTSGATTTISSWAMTVPAA